MDSGRRGGWDVLAAVAAAIVLVMIGVYVWLIRQEDGEIAVWFVAGLGAAAVLAIYGGVRTRPWRVGALTTAGIVMLVLGVFGILSIGLPIIAAGVLTMIAASRARTHPQPA
jgi:hypothetical protein